MGYISYSSEVEKCFRENPELKEKTLKQIAEFFLIQGELQYSLLREAAKSKLLFYKLRLKELDPDFVDRIDEEWKKATLEEIKGVDEEED